MLAVPRYDFNWQTYYQFAKPIAVPKGSTLRVDCALRQFGEQQSKPGSEG